jgi:hypothetical protein
MYLIYRPKGKTGRKAEILTNWVSDANMNAEKAKGAGNHPFPRQISRIFCDRNYARGIREDCSVASPNPV